MDQTLKGKVALVTGSTSGIGLAIAESLASKGADIVVNGFGDAATIETLQNSLREQYKIKVLFSAADLTKPDDITTMMRQVQQQFGKLHILVNNAGIQHVAPIEQFPAEKWQQIIALNLSAAFYTIKLAIPLMLAQRWGRIVNIASAHGMVGSPFKSAYVAAKHGLVGLTKVVALEMAEKNITVNAVCPGYVLTPLVAKQVTEQAKVRNIPEDRVIRDVLLATQPNKKFVDARHLADLVTFLCSESGASMTGEVVAMDGGWTAQ